MMTKVYELRYENGDGYNDLMLHVSRQYLEQLIESVRAYDAEFQALKSDDIDADCEKIERYAQNHPLSKWHDVIVFYMSGQNHEWMLLTELEKGETWATHLEIAERELIGVDEE